MTRWRQAQSARKCSARAKRQRRRAVMTPPSFPARRGSARARVRRVNVDSVVDLVVYMYILLCFLVLYVGFVVSVGLLHVVTPLRFTTEFSKPRLCNLIGQFEPSSL